ncbi:HdeD family acid-resistance protein [Demequina oxidasica]|uniref:HdeD family acid-resistance protein n=1 Tax=Demequina oxidasica TaxID=676199 RepID=UPI00078315C9|nr:DUF308 domain-containing protein [Demequina oxidasica]
MSNTPTGNPMYDNLVIEAKDLTGAGVSAVRTTFGILGIIGVGLGIALLVWPGKSLMVVAAISAIFFVIGGIARTAFGIFGHGLSGGTRTLNLILGLLILVGGVVVLKNLESSTEVLTIIVVIFIGIGWIIEGALTLATASRTEAKGLAYFAGIVGIIAGVVVIAVPAWSALWLVVFTGAVFVILGIVSLVRAFSFGKDSKVIDA